MLNHFPKIEKSRRDCLHIWSLILIRPQLVLALKLISDKKDLDYSGYNLNLTLNNAKISSVDKAVVWRKISLLFGIWNIFLK